jgi:glycosyltransferase involved in cell wall biosynthesis
MDDAPCHKGREAAPPSAWQGDWLCLPTSQKFLLGTGTPNPLSFSGERQCLGARSRAVLDDLHAAISGSHHLVPDLSAPSFGSVPLDESHPVRILIDLQCCQGSSGKRGIGRYALELTKAIAHNAGAGHEIWVVLNDRIPDGILPLRDQLRGHVPQERICVVSLPPRVVSFRKKTDQCRELTRLVYCHAIAGLRPDVLLLASIFEGWNDEATAMFEGLPTHILRVVIAYDLIPYFAQKKKLPRRFREWYFRQMAEFRQAHKYLAISECTRQDLIKHLQFEPETILNISAGVSDRFQRMPVGESDKKRVLKHFGITKPFLLYTGSFEPHKNIRRVVDAYSRLDPGIRASHQFVIVSPSGAGLAETKQKILQDYNLDPGEIVLTGRVTDEELLQLYNLGKAFIFPSLYEGFGLPPLEAMSCGIPTIASNISSLPEVIDWEDAMFDPLSVDSIKDKMRRVLTDEAFRGALAAHSLERSKQFSWDVTARRALDFMAVRAPRVNERGGESRNRLIAELAAVVKKTSHFQKWELGLLAKSVVRNDTEPKLPQILCDVSVLATSDAKTGIQRVSRNILSNLIQVTAKAYDVRPVVFRGGNFYYANIFATLYFTGISAADTSPTEDLPLETVPGSIYLAVDLLLQNEASYWNEMRTLRAWNIPCYFVIYDLIPIRFPKFFDTRIPELYGPWLMRAASIASGLISISEATQNDLILWLRENQIEHRADLHINFFHLGADIQNDVNIRLEAATSPTELPVDLQRRPTFLVVSTIEPRKGHEQILDAFELLWSEQAELNLVFIGKRGWVEDAFIERLKSHPESGRRFHWLNNVSDMELNHRYQNCDALIFASYAEGFGLAIVEAAQHGVPLILRDLPVFREVAGESAFYFHADESAELATAVKKWIDLSKNGRAPSSRGVRCLTWEESTRMLLRSIGRTSAPNDSGVHITPAGTCP